MIDLTLPCHLKIKINHKSVAHGECYLILHPYSNYIEMNENMLIVKILNYFLELI